MNISERDGAKLIAANPGRVTVGKSVGEALAEVQRKAGPKFQERSADRYKSNSERMYAELLESERTEGLIERWAYEPMGLRLPGWGIYWPDFLVIFSNGKMEFREIKGRGKYAVRDKARAKCLDAKRIYPQFRWKMIQRIDIGWNQIL